MPLLFAILLYILPDSPNVGVVNEIPTDPYYDYYLILFPNETYSGSLSISSNTPDVNYIEVRSLIYNHYAPRLLSKAAILSNKCTFGHVVTCPNPSYNYELIKIEGSTEFNPNVTDLLYQARAYEGSNKEKSIKLYETVRDNSPIRQKVFYSMYRLAVLHMDKNMFHSAYHYYPHRMEPLYYLARFERTAGNYSSCLLYARSAMMIGSPSIHELYVENAIYEYATEMEVVYCLHHSGRIEEAKMQQVHLDNKL